MRAVAVGRYNARVWGFLAVLVVVVGALAGCAEEDSRAESTDAWLTVSRDGRWAAFASDRASPGDGYAIYAVRLGTKPRRVTHSALHDAWPGLSPDGSTIAFARFAENGTSLGLYTVNRDGGGLRRITKRNDWAPSWSPDGKTIAFTRGQGPLGTFGSVYAVDADGGDPRVVVRDAQDPAWSPDGSRIAFVRDLEAAIAVFDLKSKRMARVSRSRSASNPAWSPDGRRITFVDMPRGAQPESPYSADDFLEIYVVNVDGTGRRRLTRNDDIDSNPTWTPDGRILFERYVGTRPSRFFVMQSDGTGVRRFVPQHEIVR
jgi:TolB protein